MSYERLPWDSDFFDLQIARVRGDVSDPEQLTLAVRMADADDIDCLYLLLPIDDQASLNVALSAGFRPYDLRVELDCELVGDTSPSVNGVRNAGPKDVPVLERIARETFRDTRFFSDVRFPRSRVQELYATWARRGVETFPRRRTLIVDDEAGFITCGFDRSAGVGTIELAGVMAGATGRGVGASLVRAANATFAQAGFTGATVVTQGRNVAAQRLYQQCGYRTRRMDVWLHRWGTTSAKLSR